MNFSHYALILLAIYWAWKLSVLAGRLDVLHRRKDLMFESLEIQLAWREHLFTEILQMGEVPIEQQAQAARVLLNLEKSAAQSDVDYFSAESDFTTLLIDIYESHSATKALGATPAAANRLRDLATACRRVALARRFHNDAVGALLLLRVRWSVRWLKLAGNTPWPRPVDLADTIPNGLDDFR